MLFRKKPTLGHITFNIFPSICLLKSGLSGNKWVQLYAAWAQHTCPDQLVAGLTDIFCHLIKALFRTGGWHKKQLVFDGFLTQPAPKKSLPCFFSDAQTLAPAVPYRADWRMVAYEVLHACVTNFSVLEHTSPCCAMQVSYAQAL